jgi:hypothetical protein
VKHSLISSFLNDSLPKPERRLPQPHSQHLVLVRDPRRPPRYVQF